MTDALRLRHVEAGYDGRTVLDDVTAEAGRGEVIAVLGPNGVGKSTLLRACVHLVAPASGVVLLGEQDVATLPAIERARRIAFLPAQTRFTLPLRVGEVVLMGRHPYQGVWQLDDAAERERAEAALRRTDTFELRNRRIDEISSGERQRVLLAAALVQEPEYLLLDEPTANLDLHHQAEFVRLLRELRNAEKAPGVVMACHDLSLAAALADRVWLLADGRLRGDGPPAEVLVPEVLEAVYRLPCVVQEGPGSLRVLPMWEADAGGGDAT